MPGGSGGSSDSQEHKPIEVAGGDDSLDLTKKRRRDSSIFVLLLLLVFLCPCLFLLFGPPTMVGGVFEFLVNNETYTELACPDGTVGDPTGLVPAVQDDPTGVDHPPDPGMPSFFDQSFFDIFMAVDAFREMMGGESFLPPGPCSPPPPPPGGGGEATGRCFAPCSTDADCAANYVCLPVGQCYVQACDSSDPSCGDGACTTDESAATCPEDCGTCGNGVCDTSETSTSCPQDCGQCGNGACDPGEHVYNCSPDCGEPPAPEDPANPPACNLTPSICRQQGLTFDPASCTCK